MKLYNKVYKKVLSKLVEINEKRNIKKLINETEKSSLQLVKSSVEDAANHTIEIVPTPENTKTIGKNWLANFINNDASEHGEDGIIKKIFSMLPSGNKWVCEFGAHDPKNISNTWHLINKENWNAVLIEADAFYFDKLQNYYKDSSRVHCVNTKVSFEGEEKLDEILKSTSAPLALDFMIIDIDGNDYHVWEAINIYQAKVVMIEFNASIPVDVSYVQPRDLSVNKGSSLKAMTELADKKGYKLIAATAWNAFFVKDEYFYLFFKETPSLADMYVYPVKHPIWMRGFQLYDGTIVIAEWNQMLWHKINLQQSDYQTLPSSYRFFNRELAAKNFVIEAGGEKTSTESENTEHLNKIYSMPGNILSQHARNNYSRYGEDGILEKIFPAISCDHFFYVDVGAYDGIVHSKSRNLTVAHGWRGLALENDLTMSKRLKENNKSYPKVKVHPFNFNLKGENSLENIFTKYSVPKEFDVLFLNLFGMEYFAWESIFEFSPKVVVAQFNPTIPNDVKFIQAKNFSIHQGCSLRALLDLAHYKGYELVAVTLETAFFVKRKYCYRLFELYGIKNVSLDEMFCPFQMRLFQLYDGTIALEGLNRLMWHGIRIDEEKLQVVPKGLRQFHQFADAETKKLFYRV